MKLRNVIKYKQLIKSLDDIGLRKNINKQLTDVLTDLNIHEFDSDNLKENIAGNHLEVLKNLEDMSNNLNKFREKLQQLVNDLEQPYYEKSKDIYKMNLAQSTQEKMDRQVYKDLLHNESSRQLLKDRIGLYVGTQYPGLHISPGYGEITNQLVSLNPLYLMDDSIDMLKKIKGWRQPQYQARLRYYVIDNNNTDPMHELPQNQLGLIVAVNWFNFKPVKVIKQYLESMLKVLRPGGVVVFTYNNCNYPKGVDKVDEMYYCYTTDTQIKQMCIQLGYDIIRSFDEGYDELDMGISWLEIKKPGTRNTIRRAQTMGLIKNLGENE